MERLAMQDLIAWKNKKNRKPMLLYGARQVGKTYLVKEFASREFKNLIYVNFEKNKVISEMINENIDPLNIIKNLEIYFNQKIDSNNTLIFFDEIQACTRALTSLKYFCEDEPEYYIVGAGSLLGVHVKTEDYSYPVGKVDLLTIYPLSFEEFLMVSGNNLLLDEIKKCFKTNKKMDKGLHDKAINLYYDYLIIGGMPEVVLEYLNTNSLISATDIQSDIIESYRSDMTKYSSEEISNKIVAAFNSIPIQLGKDNHKFQYKYVMKGGTSTIFGDAIEWIINSGIGLKCVKTKIEIPLKMNEETESFKLYMNDSGLLTNMSEFPLYLIKNKNFDMGLKIGMIVENYVASEFKKNELNLNYWENNATSEVDFVLQSNNGLIIPVEIKTNLHTKSRSLANYIEEYKPQYAIRISSKNFGFNNNIKSVPLYATFCINKINLDEEVCVKNA